MSENNADGYEPHEIEEMDEQRIERTMRHNDLSRRVASDLIRGAFQMADADPDMEPLECSYCGRLWCRGRCDPEPLVRVDPNGWEIP
jgi:hypothetical protein